MRVFITRGKRSHLNQNAWSGMVQLELNLHKMCHSYAHRQQQSHLFHQQLLIITHIFIIPYITFSNPQQPSPPRLILLLWNYQFFL
mgnify:CR=1 FL=1